jgi:hypothetical protein
MNALLDFLFEICILGLFYWLGRHIYGPGFVDKKQPLHRRILVSGIAFLGAFGVALVLVFLISEVV